MGKIEPEVVKKLVDSMPRRVKAIMDSGGNPTRYWLDFAKYFIYFLL